MINRCSSTIVALGMMFALGDAAAQPKTIIQQLVGTWMLVLCEVVAPDGTRNPLVEGANPAGQYIFTDDGHFSFQAAADFPRFVSNDRTKTTAEENRATVLGSIAYYGTFAVNDAEKTVALHIERSSFPNQNGTDGKRILTALTADEMKYINPGRRGGGSINCSYRRAK
jgi:Lipocalin-like domain